MTTQTLDYAPTIKRERQSFIQRRTGLISIIAGVGTFVFGSTNMTYDLLTRSIPFKDMDFERYANAYSEITREALLVGGVVYLGLMAYRRLK